MGPGPIVVLLQQKLFTLNSPDLFLVKSEYLVACLLQLVIVVALEIFNVGGADDQESVVAIFILEDEVTRGWRCIYRIVFGRLELLYVEHHELVVVEVSFFLVDKHEEVKLHVGVW